MHDAIAVPEKAIAKRLICLLTLMLSCPAGAAGQPFNYQWNIRDIIRTDGEEVELRTRAKRLIKKVSTSQLRILFAVKSSIEKVAELHTELIIVDGDQPNAFAGKAQNGDKVIGINVSMLDLLGRDVHAAAALIGHEIAHLKLRHGEQRASSKDASGAMRVLGGVALSALGVPGGGLISDLTITALETNYSRDHESEADYLGAIWAVEAKYEPEGAVRLHTEIYERSRVRPMPFLSSHPSGPKRIAALKALSQRLAP